MTHRKLRVPACRRRASGHAWQSARERSTRDCGAEVCQACGLVRTMSYRTGRIVGYEEDGDSIRNAPRLERHEDGAPFSSDANELPSVALTARFLALCRQYGSEQLAVSVVAAGRSTEVWADTGNVRVADYRGADRIVDRGAGRRVRCVGLASCSGGDLVSRRGLAVWVSTLVGREVGRGSTRRQTWAAARAVPALTREPEVPGGGVEFPGGVRFERVRH